jgi:hypothetical protein
MERDRYLFPAAAILLVLLCAVTPYSSNASQGERVIALPDLERPTQIIVEGGRVYFADSRDVKVFDLRDGRLLRKIGRLGQGPGEFSIEPRRMDVLGDRLIVQDLGHADCFTLDGAPQGRSSTRVPWGFIRFFPSDVTSSDFPSSGMTRAPCCLAVGSMISASSS